MTQTEIIEKAWALYPTKYGAYGRDLNLRARQAYIIGAEARELRKQQKERYQKKDSMSNEPTLTPFNLEEWLEDKSRKVLTEDGREATIHTYQRKCKKPGEQLPFPIIATVQRDEFNLNEDLYECTKDGQIYTPQKGYTQFLYLGEPKYKPKYQTGDILGRKGFDLHTVKYYDKKNKVYVCTNENGVKSTIFIGEQDAWNLVGGERVAVLSEDIDKLIDEGIKNNCPYLGYEKLKERLKAWTKLAKDTGKPVMVEVQKNEEEKAADLFDGCAIDDGLTPFERTFARSIIIMDMALHNLANNSKEDKEGAIKSYVHTLRTEAERLKKQAIEEYKEEPIKMWFKDATGKEHEVKVRLYRGTDCIKMHIPTSE